MVIMDTAVKGAVDISSGVWSGVKVLGGMALDAMSCSTSSDNGGLRFGFSKRVPNWSTPAGLLGVGNQRYFTEVVFPELASRARQGQQPKVYCGRLDARAWSNVVSAQSCRVLLSEFSPHELPLISSLVWIPTRCLGDG